MVSGSVCFLTVLCLVRVAFLELQNLRVEIVPDGQTSFVRKTTAESVITESDYSPATGPRMPRRAGERSRLAPGGAARGCLSWLQVRQVEGVSRRSRDLHLTKRREAERTSRPWRSQRLDFQHRPQMKARCLNDYL